MSIPRKTHLAGLTVDVIIDHNLYLEKKIVGEARYPSQEIVLDPTIVGIESIEQNYWHELVHWVFFMMNEHELRQNERIVDMMAHFLYQATKSAEGTYTEEDIFGTR